MQYLISEAEKEELKEHYLPELNKLRGLAKRIGKVLLKKYKNKCIYHETKPIGYCSSCILYEIAEEVSKDNHNFVSEHDVIDFFCGSDKHFGK